MHKKISWDFWDTLVTRILLNSHDLFQLIEITEKASGFKTARLNAELQALKYHIQPTIDDIYIYLPHTFDKHRLQQREIQLDILLSTPIKENIQKLRNTDYILSDYHIGAHHLHQILEFLNIEFPADQILVSSELAQSKTNGNLFQHLRDRDVRNHVGDNHHADYIMAKKSGINSLWFKNSSNVTIDEFSWRALSSINNPYESLCALMLGGVSRATRLQRPLDTSMNKWNLISDIVAPFSFAFLSWIDTQSSKQKIEHLYFCARDGWLFYIMAKGLKEKGLLFTNVKLTYFYSSRIAQESHNFRKYISEIGLIDEALSKPRSLAIVDVGWAGSMQLKLNEALLTEAHSLSKTTLQEPYVSGFYVYCDNPLDQKQVHSYLSDDFEPSKNVRRFCDIIEAIFTSPEGSVIGYSDEDVSPILGPQNINQEFTAISTTVFELYTQLLVKSLSINNYKRSHILTNSVVNFQRFLLNPTQKEAAAFSKYKHQIHQDQKDKHLIGGLMHLLFLPFKKTSFWREGILAYNRLNWAYKLWKKNEKFGYRHRWYTDRK
jgi:predicted HAD superfamily hydrolase